MYTSAIMGYNEEFIELNVGCYKLYTEKVHFEVRDILNNV